jgi:hypothetical protein
VKAATGVSLGYTEYEGLFHINTNGETAISLSPEQFEYLIRQGLENYGMMHFFLKDFEGYFKTEKECQDIQQKLTAAEAKEAEVRKNISIWQERNSGNQREEDSWIDEKVLMLRIAMCLGCGKSEEPKSYLKWQAMEAISRSVIQCFKSDCEHVSHCELLSFPLADSVEMLMKLDSPKDSETQHEQTTRIECTIPENRSCYACEDGKTCTIRHPETAVLNEALNKAKAGGTDGGN